MRSNSHLLLQSEYRLVYLIGELHTGGSERQLYYLLRGMDKQRYRPAVIVWNYFHSDLHLHLIQALGVPVYGLPSVASRLRKLQALTSLVKRFKPEVLHSWSFYTNFAAYYSTLGSDIISVGSIRSDFSWAQTDCGWLVGSLSARWPYNQICNSVSAAERIRAMRGPFVPTIVNVVRNGLDLELFDNVSPSINGTIKILGVGSLVPVKRWDRVLSAAVGLRDKGLAFMIRVVGDGPLYASLRQQTKNMGMDDYVQFIGQSADIASLLAESNFLVHTADHEGTPNCIMEAMACGRAVVSTDVGDVRYLVEHGKTGFVVNVRDTSMLIERMGILINRPELCLRMGQPVGRKPRTSSG